VSFVRFTSIAFVLAALLPIAIASIAWRWRTNAVAWTFPDWDVVAAAPRTWRERLRLTPAFLRLASLTALAIAAAEPFSPARQVDLIAVPSTVVVVIDASGSMLAMDLLPDRFGAARKFAADVIARRPADRVGLLAFGGRTSMLCPITADRTALEIALRDARAGATELDEGTALGAALVAAIEQIEHAPAPAEAGRGPRQNPVRVEQAVARGVIVVLSDGATNDSRLDPIDAAALAARRNIPVYAIGFGRDGPARYPTEMGVLDVQLPVRDEILQRVASDTGGRYWRVTDDAAIDGVLAALDGAERPAPVRRERVVLVSRQRPIVLVAIVLLIVEIALAAGPLRVRNL
jgi:Ca-activated chloride channel homolog